jgi:hypothetical protein
MAWYRRPRDASPRSSQPCTPGNYYEVKGEFYTWYVSAETVVQIGQQLERRWRPQWIKFVDLHGARVWVRGDAIFHLTESTERQRFRQRELSFMLSQERQAEDKLRYPACEDDGDGYDWE